MKTLGELVREPAKHGWKIMNLFEIPNGQWRCNVHGPQGRSTGFTEFADGNTPEAAVSAAIEHMHIAIKRGMLSAEQQRDMKVFEAAVRRLARKLGVTEGLF